MSDSRWKRLDIYDIDLEETPIKYPDIRNFKTPDWGNRKCFKDNPEQKETNET